MRTALFVGLLGLASGCMGRALTSVENGYGDEGGRNVVLQTVETKNYWLYAEAKIVWWDCLDDGKSLTCKKTCDVKDDEGDKLLCQRVSSF